MVHGRDNRGFTLIELAVVLVIVGLLVGGVLQGQELVYQARLNNFVAVIKDTQRAMVTFEAKYGKPPGDLDKATQFFPDCLEEPGNIWFLYCNGNGDGKIKRFMPDDNSNWHAESMAVWRHLSLAQLIKGDYNRDENDGSPAFPKVELPYSRSAPGETGYSTSNQMIIENPEGPGYSLWPAGRTELYIMYTWFLSGGGEGVPNVLGDIDKKIDDGKPASGFFYTYGWVVNATDMNPNACADYNANTYLLPINFVPGDLCNVGIKIAH